ncbi:MAG: gamma-glutamyltransferase family protein [Polyangiaceae bacterium]
MRFLASIPSWSLPIAAALGLALTAPSGHGAPPPVEQGAVATEHALSTRAAREMLRLGGNAVDAAIAAALTAGVVTPTSSGLGGGGFALVLGANELQPRVLDFREVAPRGVSLDALEKRPLPFEQRGHLVGVPGEPAGLWELSKRFGKRPWSSLAQPAIRSAKLGFAVGPHLARMLGASGDLAREKPLAALFFGGGTAKKEGAQIKNPELARTLSRFAAEGPKAIYTGAIAQELVETARAAGSSIEQRDLDEYSVKERNALHVAWAGHDVFTMPAPSAGGLLLAETLGTLSVAELTQLGYQSGAAQHLVAEAFRSALADRFRYAGDPDFVPDPSARLLEPARLAKKRVGFALDRTHSLPLLVAEEHGTHHIVVADAAGTVVSLTTTVNRLFGAKLVAKNSGIVLNDELDDFTLGRDAAAFGLAQSPNTARAGARPVSSMTPTIVLKQGRPVLALGGSGGMAISTNVTQLLLARLAFGKSPAELTRMPRIFMPLKNDTIWLEAGAPQALLDDLGFRGERVGKAPPFGTAVQVLARDDGLWQAAADPRKYGVASDSSGEHAAAP